MWAGAAALLLAGCVVGAAQAQVQAVDVAECGLVADGETDDGPAIAQALAAARAADGPVVFRFPENKTIRVATAPDRYVFPLDATADIELDGGGCTFVLDPYLRFMRLDGARRVAVRRLNVDFDPLPFADGVVVAVDNEARFVDVRLWPGQGAAPAGEPTGEDGEQAFFSMLWYEGPYQPIAQHYWTARIEPTDKADTVRVYCTDAFKDFERIEPGTTGISVAVPGIAHRYGPGPCFVISDCEGVTFEDVELWAAPWFGFNVMRCRGAVAFRRAHIRPRPGTPRLMSLWRDGFHVKGNSASLRWEDCIVTGTNDDAFNISTQTCAVRKAISPERIEIGQKFPLGYIPWRVGATLAAADEETGRLLPSHRVVAVEESPAREVGGHPAGPARIALTLDGPAPDLKPGVMVWDPAWANPDTLLRNCTIDVSCRMQSPVRLEDCTVTALLWFYCEHVEGPFPSGVRISNCTLRRGRGNPDNAVVFSGLPASAAGNPDAAAPPRAIHAITIENNRIHGGFLLEGCQGVRITGNRFLEPGAAIAIRRNHGLVMEDNRDAEGRAVTGE